MHLSLYGEEHGTLKPPSLSTSDTGTQTATLSGCKVNLKGWMEAAPTEQQPIPTSPENSIARHEVGAPSPEPKEEIVLAAPSPLPTTIISFLSCHFMKGITLHSTTVIISEAALKNNSPVKSCQPSCTTRKSNTHSEVQT